MLDASATSLTLHVPQRPLSRVHRVLLLQLPLHSSPRKLFICMGEPAPPQSMVRGALPQDPPIQSPAAAQPAIQSPAIQITRRGPACLPAAR